MENQNLKFTNIKNKNSNILVTGGSGVIGKELIKLLISKGHKVYNIDLIEAPENKYDSENYCFINESLESVSEETILKIQPQKIFHLAATFERTSESFDHFENNYVSNVASTHYLLKKIYKLNKLESFVFASSYLVYDPSLYLFSKSTFTTKFLGEKDRKSPRNLTGHSKYYNEKEIRFLFEDFLNAKFISARIFRGYGLGSKDFISRSISKVLKKETLEIFNIDGSFDYLYSKDAAEGLLRLSQSNFSGEINLGIGKTRSIKSVLDCMEEVFGKFKYNVNHSNKDYLENSASDNSLLKATIDWTPNYNFKKSLEEIGNYQK